MKSRRRRENCGGSSRNCGNFRGGHSWANAVQSKHPFLGRLLQLKRSAIPLAQLQSPQVHRQIKMNQKITPYQGERHCRQEKTPAKHTTAGGDGNIVPTPAWDCSTVRRRYSWPCGWLMCTAPPSTQHQYQSNTPRFSLCPLKCQGGQVGRPEQ
jgi:hypothetical protein